MTSFHRARLAASTATLAAHLAVAGRYDFFRDELYFIACGRHPSWGYVDQPPLVPLLAAATQAFGESLVALRALSALAAAATVWVTMALARALGGGGFGAIVAGVAAAIAPMYLGVMTTVGTSTFEPLTWTLIAYLVVRALDEPRFWIWVGVVVGVELECKWALPVWLVPLVVALVATGHARALGQRQVAIGAALAVVIAAPGAIWQLAHGLPFVEMVRNQAHEGKNVALAPLAFVKQQVMVLNPLLAPLWLAGVIAPFVDARWRRVRFLSLAFVATFALMLLAHGKDYYLAPLYGAMFAVGGAATATWLRARAVVAAYLVAATVLSAIAAPLAMPILPPAKLVAYMRALHLGLQAAENLRQSPLPQTLADMFGWRELTARVSAAVRTLPPDEQRRIVILARNYGEAGALDFYGHGLPTVVSGHNHYYVWGLRGATPDGFVAFNRSARELAPYCRETRELGRFDAEWVMPFENDSPITLCRGVHPSLAELWPKVKLFY